MSMQLNKHNGQKYICNRCLHYFHSNQKLQLHIVDCQRINDCAIRLPSNDDKKERVPFVVYADLECILEKIDSDKDESTLTYQHHHQVFSIEYYVRCSYDNSLSKYRFRRNPDCRYSHFIIKEIATAYEGSIELLPITKEKYISEDDFELLIRKEIFPYEYIDCADKLQDTRLPSRESFYSSLTGDTVSEAIEPNIKFRTLAKNDFEKNLFKLMNNAIFGKTMENVRNHIDVKLLTQWNRRYGAETMIAKPNFQQKCIF
ncbi:hypothetical protein ALC57_05325 [Trachymyrmex cornetzi]|uniref:C2H2-type domain-containing protein n=1 Tax=Trachymyrmex cornetzi TaxID=471704 RepID=A0A151JBB3_9HYME|nr:hypothetical protein ALC57_05325 [Trachymyrmex cornetzi]